MPQKRSLKRELVRAQEEIKRIQSVPLVIGQFMEAIDQKYAVTFFFVQFLGLCAKALVLIMFICLALVSYKAPLDPTMSFEFYLLSTENFLSLRHQ